ncbi:MAG TPA: hypothetical protein VF621_03630 [Pyrinomonadaceae bacterium]|jgi:hypothetical protein
MLFFVGVGAPLIVVKGFTSAGVLMLILDGVLLYMLYYLQSRAQRRAAYFFDLFVVTPGDSLRIAPQCNARNATRGRAMR